MSPIDALGRAVSGPQPRKLRRSRPAPCWLPGGSSTPAESQQTLASQACSVMEALLVCSELELSPHSGSPQHGAGGAGSTPVQVQPLQARGWNVVSRPYQFMPDWRSDWTRLDLTRSDHDAGGAGSTAVRVQLLQARGWEVVSVPFFEWRQCGGQAAKQAAYLRQKLPAKLLEVRSRHAACPCTPACWPWCLHAAPCCASHVSDCRCTPSPG